MDNDILLSLFKDRINFFSFVICISDEGSVVKFFTVNIQISYMKIMIVNLLLNLMQTCMVLPVRDGFLVGGE